MIQGLKNPNRLYWLFFLLTAVLSVFVVYFIFEEKSIYDQVPVPKNEELSSFEKDQKGFAKAIESHDVAECLSIQDSELRKNCEDGVIDAKIYQEALNSRNVEKCSEMKLVSRKEACAKNIAHIIAESATSSPVEK